MQEIAKLKFTMEDTDNLYQYTEDYMNIRKGDIFYIYKQKPPLYNYTGMPITGSPAIIISGKEINNDKNVIVVYLTTTPRGTHASHVPISSTGIDSVALCEKMHTVHKERIGDYIASCTEDEINRLEHAICNTLDITLSSSEDALRQAEEERDSYKRLYEEAIHKTVKKKFLFF